MSKQIVLLAKSSSGEPHKVAFVFDGKLKVLCDCEAAVHNMLCKHRIAFVNHDAAMLYDASQKRELAEVQELVQASQLPKLLAGFIETEKEVEQAKKRLAAQKEVVATAMRHGL